MEHTPQGSACNRPCTRTPPQKQLRDLTTRLGCRGCNAHRLSRCCEGRAEAHQRPTHTPWDLDGTAFQWQWSQQGTPHNPPDTHTPTPLHCCCGSAHTPHTPRRPNRSPYRTAPPWGHQSTRIRMDTSHTQCRPSGRTRAHAGNRWGTARRTLCTFLGLVGTRPLHRTPPCCRSRIGTQAHTASTTCSWEDPAHIHQEGTRLIRGTVDGLGSSGCGGGWRFM